LPHILEVGAAMPIEVERRPERGPRARESERRRKGARSTEAIVPVESLEALPVNDDSGIDTLPANGEAPEPLAPAHVPDMLAELVGRDIATRLRARYAEITARIHQMDADDATRAAWQTRAEPLNPDSWITPDEILAGVSRADELFDNLRRALLG
jgi:hypothetical protein